MNEHLVRGRYSIKDLVDLKKLKGLLDRFTEASGCTTSFISYPDIEILIATGWKDMCTVFHRGDEASEQICIQSNRKMLEKLQRVRELSIGKCPHGLVDGSTPIIIDGIYVACMVIGQVFFEEPDLEWFSNHAKTMGYDVDAYLKTVKMIPVVSEDQFKLNLIFLTDLAVIVCEMGLRNLLEKEENYRHIKTLEGLVPMCAHCKKMLPEGKDPREQKSWLTMEQYITERSEAEFTHGLCPGCISKTKEQYL